MEVVLKPSWILSDEHSASSYGKPVLVNRGTQEAYGPSDVLKAYPSWGYLPGSYVVRRMMGTSDLSREVAVFCESFFL